MSEPSSRELDVSFAPVDVSAHPSSTESRPQPYRQKSTVIFRPARDSTEYDMAESNRHMRPSAGESSDEEMLTERLSTRRLDVSKGLDDSLIRREMEEISERNTASKGVRHTDASDFTITREDDDYGMNIWEDYKEELDAHYYAVDNKEKRRVQALTCIAVLAAVSLTLALVLGISYGTDKSQPYNNNNIKTSTVLPLPPIIMGSKCDPENIKTPKGWAECEHVCRTAACCHIPIGTKGSCLDATFDICEQYEVSCRPIRDALAGGSSSSSVSFSVPPAPHDIGNICHLPDVTNIASVARCEEMCLPAACCLSPDPATNCMKENAAMCMAYVPYCGKISLHGVDPSTVDEACGGTDRGEDCWAACSTAACCFPEKFRKTFGRSVVGCDVRDERWCEMFERCEVLPDMEEVYTEEDKIVFIEEVCTEDAVAETAGLNVCHDLCKARECCYDPSATGCSKDRCDGYEPCKVLNKVNTTEAVEGKFMNSVAHVKFACQEERISSSRWGYHACESVCEERQCCFVPEDGREENCRSKKTEWCEEFDACKVLINATVPEADDASTPDFGKPVKSAISGTGSTTPEITDGPVAMPGYGKPDNSGSAISGNGSTTPEITDGPVAMPGNGKPDKSGTSSSSNVYGPGVGNSTTPEITDGPVAMPGNGKPDNSGSAISGNGSITPEITDGPVAMPGNGKPDNSESTIAGAGSTTPEITDGPVAMPGNGKPDSGSTIAGTGSTTPEITDGPVDMPGNGKPDNSESTIAGAGSTTPEITDGPVAMPGNGKPDSGSTIAGTGSTTPEITDGPVDMPGNGKPENDGIVPPDDYKPGNGSTISTAGSTPEITDGPVEMHNDKPPPSGNTISGTGSTPEITDGPVGTPRSGEDKDRLAAPGYTPPDKDEAIVPPDDYEPPRDNENIEDSRLAKPGYTPPDKDEGIVPPEDYEPPNDNENTEDSRLAKPGYTPPDEDERIVPPDDYEPQETQLAALEDKSAVYDLVARIGELCTINNILSPEGYHACKESCSSRLCCFFKGSLNCRLDITKECHMFSECDNLNDVHMPSMP